MHSHRLVALRSAPLTDAVSISLRSVLKWTLQHQINTHTHRGSVTVALGTHLINSNTSYECVNRPLYCTYSNKILLSFFWQAFKHLVILRVGTVSTFSSEFIQHLSPAS